MSMPLCDVVIEALHKAVDDQANAATFHGYMPEVGHLDKQCVACILDATFHGYMPEVGAAELRRTIEGYYKKMGANITEKDIFVSSGACDDLGDILELFDQDNTVMIIEPAYPEYVHRIILPVLFLTVISCRLGWTLPMRSVPLSCLMRRMRYSLRRRTFRTASPLGHTQRDHVRPYQPS